MSTKTKGHGLQAIKSADGKTLKVAVAASIMLPMILGNAGMRVESPEFVKSNLKGHKGPHVGKKQREKELKRREKANAK